MPYRSASKTEQFKCLTQEIIFYKDPSRVIFLGMSNDLESLIFQCGNLLRVKPNAHARWGKLSSEEKAHFNHNALKLLHNNSVTFLKWRLSLYVEQLSDLFSNTSAQVVYHLSVLERLMPLVHPNLPMHMAILNSFLFTLLKKIAIRNKFGQKIRFQFVNVATQFYSEKNPSILFRDNEVYKGVMVHRTMKAYQNIFATVRSKVIQDIGLCN